MMNASISKGAVVCSLLLFFGSMDVAYSRGGGHHGGGHHGGGHHGGGHHGGGHHGGGHHGGYHHGGYHDGAYRHGGRGWNRGWGTGGLVGVGVWGNTYPTGCVWVPQHRNRYGTIIPGHRAC